MEAWNHSFYIAWGCSTQKFSGSCSPKKIRHKDSAAVADQNIISLSPKSNMWSTAFTCKCTNNHKHIWHIFSLSVSIYIYISRLLKRRFALINIHAKEHQNMVKKQSTYLKKIIRAPQTFTGQSFRKSQSPQATTKSRGVTEVVVRTIHHSISSASPLQQPTTTIRSWKSRSIYSRTERGLETHQGRHSIKHPCCKQIIKEEKDTYQITWAAQDVEEEEQEGRPANMCRKAWESNLLAKIKRNPGCARRVGREEGEKGACLPWLQLLF